MKVAEVVRDLWRRERERGLSAGEKRMLAKARQILVSELALAERVEEDKAEHRRDQQKDLAQDGMKVCHLAAMLGQKPQNQNDADEMHEHGPGHHERGGDEL